MWNKRTTSFCFILVVSMVFHRTAGWAQQSTRLDTLRELMRRIDILTQELEKVKLGEVATESRHERRYGMGPAASRVYRLVKPGVSVAGYGEIVYQDFSSKTEDDAPSGKVTRIDFLRLVTYFGFRFNDRLLFNSEVEFEHAKTAEGAPGEVAIEFGYVEAMLHKGVNLRAGMLLLPVGIINELHEPPTFLGSLRPEAERRIIPATWRANGVGFVATTADGLGLKVYLIEGLNAAKFSSDGIRSGRQNGAKAIAEDLALSGRLNYSGFPGLDIGGSFYVGNSGQDLTDSSGSQINAKVRLFSLHVLFARRGFELRGLYVNSKIGDADQLNKALGLNGDSSIGEDQFGYYLTAGYNILPLLAKGSRQTLIPFVQFERFNTQNSVPAGFSKDPARDRKNITFGISYKPIQNIAFKADYIKRSDGAKTAVDQFNLAVNYLF